MAGVTNVDGDARPRQIVRIQPSPASNLALDTSKVLALVGPFPYLEPAVPTTVTTSAALKRLDPLDYELQLIERLIYDAAPADQDVSNNPAAVVLVNAQPSTQASVTLVDSNGDASLVVSSRLWGAVGNRFTALVGDGTVRGKKYTFTAPSPLQSVVVDNVGGNDIIVLRYTGSQATTMAAAFDTTNGLRISYTKTAIALGTLSITDIAFDGRITFTPSVGAGVGESYTCTVTGVNKATNAADTETVTFTNADGTTPEATVKYWSSVTSIVFAATAGTPTFTIAGYSFDLPPVATGLSAGYPTAASLATRVNGYTGYTATTSSVTAASTLTTLMDETASATIKAANVGLRADILAATTALAGISLVEVTRADNAALPPDNLTSARFLGGAIDGTETTDSWTAAFAALEDITATALHIWADTESAAYQALGLEHCNNQVKVGGHQRSMHVGATADESLTDLSTRRLAFNSAWVDLWFQEFQRTDQTGTEVWLAPKYLALVAAAMLCRMAPGTPLTYKRPKMTAVRCNANIIPAQDGNELINSGLCYALKRSDGTFIFERPVTTYGEADNVFYTEPGCVESFMMSNNALNFFIASRRAIGSANTKFSKLRFKSLVIQGLNKQVQSASQLIFAWGPDSLVITVDGGYYIANYDVEPIRGVNFIEFRPTPTTISVAA